MENEPIDVSIIIVSYNTKDLTRKCLKSVERNANDVRYEVLIVDNNSTDRSADMIANEFPWVELIRLAENRGFAGGNNIGIKKARGRYVLLLNSDAFLSEGTLKKTIYYMDLNCRIGILGCKLTGADGNLQPSARMLPSPLNKILHITGLAARFPHSRFFGRADYSWWNHSAPRNVGWVVGAFLMVRRQTINEIGYLDELYFLYFEEIDYCLSACRAGWEVVFYPYANITHLGGQSSVKTQERVSAKGKQMLSIRITSEFRYYRKQYGCFYVLMSAMIELSWNLAIFVKNVFSLSIGASYKRNEAVVIAGLIVTTLWKDRWGSGKGLTGARYKS